MPTVSRCGADEAYSLAIDTVATTAEVSAVRGKVMPPPVAPVDDWSGRVTLRVPRSLHRALSEAADGEGCSLNHHLVNVLTYFAGYAHAESAAEAHWRAEPVPVGSTSAHHPELTVAASNNYDTATGDRFVPSKRA